jgi:transposase
MHFENGFVILMAHFCMPKIRKVKTASGATAIQVVAYRNRKVVVIKHIGSAHSNEEVDVLESYAKSFIETHGGQLSIFPSSKDELLSIKHSQYLYVGHKFAREFMLSTAEDCRVRWLSPIILDMAIMRIIEPTSKLRTLELIERYFHIHYGMRAYKRFREILKNKTDIERSALEVVKDIFTEDIYLVLYDVTTLYFETYHQDELRKVGYSKDDKSKQPQIVVGLLVTKSGFPLAHEVFSGNTFEGKTMLPVLENYTKSHNITMPTVVADAAMLSEKVLVELRARKIHYIVGACIANQGFELIKSIAEKLNKQDNASIRIQSKHGDMICSFSKERYKKDKREMEKQIQKAERLVARNESGSRAKFVRKTGNHSVEINKELINKTNLLLGIKGYCTNIEGDVLSNSEVIKCYHDLWHVEQAFRMSKSDLASRPVFHHKQDAVKAHVLLCFLALMLAKYLELVTGLSIRRIIDLIWDVTDAYLRDNISGKTHIMRSPMDGILNSPLRKLITKWNLSY